MDSLTRPAPQTGRRRPLDSAIGSVVALVATILGLIVLAWAILFVTKGRFLKPTFVKYASRYADRPVAVGGDFQFYFNPFHLKFLAEDLSVANPAWARDRQLFTARLIDTEISTWDLIFGRQHVLYLDLDGATAGLEIDKAGRNTWTFAGDTPFEVPPIDRATVTNTAAHYIDAKHAADVRLTFGDLAGQVRPGGRENVSGPLTFRGGGTALAHPFSLRGAFTTPNATITGGHTGIELHADVAETAVDVSGTLPGPTRIEGADLRVAIAGRNLQTLFKLAGATAPATRPYRLAANFTKDGSDYRFTHLTGRFGDSDLAGQLAVQTGGARPKLTADLRTNVLDIVDIGPWIGYSPDKLEAAKQAKAAGRTPPPALVTTAGGHPRILPGAPLDLDALKAFDADVKYRAATIRTGTVPVTNLVVNLGLDDRRLRLTPVAFDVIGGRLTGMIDLNARARPVATAYDIRMTAVPLGKLLTSFKVEDNGTTANVAGHVALHGSGDSVRASLGSSSGRIAVVVSQGTLWIRNIELAKLDVQNFIVALLGRDLKKPRDIRCGVAAFTVRDGVSTADPVLFDTGRAVYAMKGQFSFKDETIGLSLRGRSKEFSLFSGQSPIGIGGYFAAPSVNPISKELIGRAGGAVVLGVVATPVAAILPFVDLGLAKNSNCAAVEKAETAAQVQAAPHDPKTAKQKKKVLGIF
ncbi:MAG: AsmA family protein [Sphingomonadaceae bacterium]|nr:AsmA family protein [Sphingomonadaceae bacterium]